MQVQYDPALYIGRIVEMKHMKHLMETSRLHQEIAIKKESLNYMKKLKLEFKSLSFELFDEKERKEEWAKLDKDVKKVQMEYWKTAMKNYKALAALRKEPVTHSLESPVDWEKSNYKDDLAIAADSMHCDARWFIVDDKKEGTKQQLKDIKHHLEGSLGASFNGNISSKIERTADKLHSTSSKVLSTLIISCMCTHKNASTLAPCVFDTDKLIQTWNDQFPKNRINSWNSDQMKKMYHERKGKHEKDKLHMVSGASYASAIVGMVTFMDESRKKSGLSSEQVNESMNKNMEFKNVISKLIKFFNDLNIEIDNDMMHKYVKKGFTEIMDMHFNQTMSMQFNLYCAGFIPHLERQTLSTKVEITGPLDTQGLKRQMKEVVRELGQEKPSEMSVLNIDTMMNAFDDYILKATKGKVGVLGVPMNYFLKPISKDFIIDRWMEKNYPREMRGDSEWARSREVPEESKEMELISPPM